jgi:hypothetical protein
LEKLAISNVILVTSVLHMSNYWPLYIKKKKNYWPLLIELQALEYDNVDGPAYVGLAQWGGLEQFLVVWATLVY